MNILILAAGQGKRMNSAVPKVLQPLAGRPLLGHVLLAAAGLAPSQVVIVHGHGAEAVREAFDTALVKWALQSPQLGTGHAVMQGMPHIENDALVLILYGDVPLVRERTLVQLVGLAGPRALSLLTVKLPDPHGYGRVLRDKRGQVRRIVEQRDASPGELRVNECNTGVMCVPAGLLRKWLAKLRNDNAQGEYYLTDIIALAVRDKVQVMPLIAEEASEVLGINDRAQLAQAEAAYRLQRCRELMSAGATLVDPSRCDVRGVVDVGRDVFIDVNVVFEGRVTLGDRVRIGPNCVLRDIDIGADTQVFANSLLEQSLVGRDCRIGPFARLRPGAKLADEVHIGNFVEVKNSDVGKGSKANHLAYIGDATIGAGVNVGAGTITCNYDGANKHRTVIGDGVFVGSGSMLVAPVTLGAQATIGAGSTITREAPAGRLTLERAQQITVENWSRPVKVR
ncbi:MAG: bifunctional UDP-N-acetylglucosamine diphosphorylase/glucosamine-1-phosphate N-acetyltransferase GlmU [Steroidobacteraceae bacterium]